MAERKIRIGIIGLGYVGLTLAIAAASTDRIEVFGLEKNAYIKECIKAGKAHFFEPGLDILIKRTYKRSFFVIDEFPTNIVFDAFIITVGTPLKRDGGAKEPDYESIKSALNDAIKKVYDGNALVVLRSTVSIGTTRKIIIPYLAEMCGRKYEDVLVSMCPERTLEGKAVYELSNLPQIISGNNKKSVDIARKIFGLITPSIVEAESLEEAELIKLYCNTYRDMHFAIGNVFCMAAQEFGVNGLSAIEHANHGYPRSNIAKPGFVAGPCLEKDAYILINNMPDCESKKIILEMRKYNESLEDTVVSWVKRHMGAPDSGKIVALSGMAFKGQPETSDLRGSSAVSVAKKLLNLGYHLNIHDFIAYPEEMEALGIGEVFTELKDACKDAQILLVLNNNKRYQLLTGDMIIEENRRDFQILDVWGVCTELHYTDQLSVFTLGNMLID